MIVGFTVFGKLKNNFNLNKYEQIDVIITHLHNDHAGTLSQLILYMWFVFNKKITVYSKCKNIKTFLDITGTPEESYELKTYSDNLEFIKTEHAKDLDSYGFKLRVNNKNIVYTGDTITLEPFFPYLKDCDKFYVDVSKNSNAHLNFENAIQDLRKIKSNNTKVFLMHIDDKDYIKKINNNEFFID